MLVPGTRNWQLINPNSLTTPLVELANFVFAKTPKNTFPNI
jgi:hypothetical protein